MVFIIMVEIDLFVPLCFLTVSAKIYFLLTSGDIVIDKIGSHGSGVAYKDQLIIIMVVLTVCVTILCNCVFTLGHSILLLSKLVQML